MLMGQRRSSIFLRLAKIVNIFLSHRNSSQCTEASYILAL